MKKTYYLLLFLLTILCPVITRASHAQGADLAYKFVSYNSITGAMKYYVTATFYRDCSGIPTTSTIPLMLTDTTCNGGTYDTTFNLPLINGLPCPFGGVSGVNGCEVSHLCAADIAQSACNGGSQYPGMQKYVYADTITLPGGLNLCSKWTISIDVTARNPSSNLVNSASFDLYIEAVINNTIDPTTGQPYRNSSPVFQNDPVPFVCLNSSAPLTYNNAGADGDGDSLVYSLVNPLQAHNDTIAFTTGYSVTSPVMSSIPCRFDSSTGIFTYKPIQTEIDVMAYLIKEYRHGVLIGSTMRDVEMKILNCNEYVPVIGNPTIVQGGVLIDSNSVKSCPGDDLIIDVPVTEPSFTNLTLSSSISQFPPVYSGMTFTQIGTGDSVRGRIEWQSVDTGCRYIYIKANSDDCPVESNIFKAIKICSGSGITISPASAVYCGRPVMLTTSTTTPIWTPATGISSTTTAVTYVSPSVSTWYHVYSACGNDSVLVKVEPIVTTGIIHDTSVCNAFPVQLYDHVTGTGSYSYAWSPTPGLSDATIANPIFNSNLTTLYHCVITDTSGCVLDDSVKVTVRGNGRLMLRADTVVAAGQQSQLNAMLAPFYAACTSVPGNAVTQQSQVQIGTDTLIAAGTAFAYPAPFGAYYKSARHQILFHASELQAIFGTSRLISSLSFNIGTLYSTASLANFTIKIGCVNADSLTGFEGGQSLTTVWEDTAYTPVAGWNSFSLQNAYAWDGVSDVIVDMCFSGSSTGNINNRLRYTITPFRSIWCTYANDPGGMCGYTGRQTNAAPAYATYFQRPDVKFGLATVTSGFTNLQWQPSSGTNAVANATAASTSATVNTNQWYTATLADSVCGQSDSIFVRVLTHPVHASFDTTICLGDSISSTAYNGTTYSWSDDSGVLSTASTLSYAPSHSSNIILVMTDGSGNVYTDTSHVNVLDQHVWPGDANDDHIVDNNDILYIGIAYDDTGSVRPNASVVWTSQCAAAWDSSFVGGVNVAHGDCNGDGRVDYNDTVAVSSNWGFSHAKTTAQRQSNYTLTITTDKATYYQYDTIVATLSLADNNNPIPAIYGVAYDFNYTSTASAHIISVDQSMSWMNRKLDFDKVIQPVTAYLAQSRIDHKDTSGYGKIAEVRLVVDGALLDSAYLSTDAILALDKNGDTVYVSTAAKSINIAHSTVGIESVDKAQSIDIYPNPNSGSFRVMQSNIGMVTMSMTDEIGREVYTKILTNKVTTVDLIALPDGVYIASFISASGISSKRIVIAK